MGDAYEVYPTQTVVKCDVCGRTDNVQWYCKNCPGSLCDSCKAIHRNTDISRAHVIISRTHSVVRTHGPAKIAEECPRHKGKELSAYCKACDDACCIQCLAEDHQNHKFCPIDEAYLNAENRLNSYIRELDGVVRSELDELTKHATAAIETRNSTIIKVKDKVNSFRKEMKDAVDKSCDFLIDSLEIPNSDRNNFVLEIEKHKQNVDHLINDCTAKIREGKFDIIKYNPPSPPSLIPIKENVIDVVPEFVPLRELLEMIKQGVGSIEYMKVKSEAQVENQVHPVPTFDKGRLHVQKVSSYKSKVDATAIAVAGNNTAWIADHTNDTMYQYDNRGKFVRSVTVMKGVGINDLVVKMSGEMIITNTDKKVRMVDKAGRVTTLIDTTPFDAEGISLTGKEKIMVCMGRQEEKYHIAIYSADGMNKVREIKAIDSKNEKPDDQPIPCCTEW